MTLGPEAALVGLLFALAPGDPIPALTLTVANVQATGRTLLSLEDAIGVTAKPKGPSLVLLATTSSGCAPCVADLPALQRLHDELRPRGVLVLLVSLDRGRDALAGAERAIAGVRPTFPVLVDRHGLAASRMKGLRAPLYALVEARSGRVTRVFEGTGPLLEEAEREMRRLLAVEEE